MWSKNIHFNCLSLRKPQIVNHYEFNSELTTKDKLFLNMNEFCESNKSNVFDYLPLTFVFDTSSKDYCNFLQQFFQIFRSLEQIENTEQGSSINKANKIISFFYPTKPKSFTKPKLWDSQIGSNIWIIKPTGFNRGRGVSVFSDLITLKKLINEFVGNEETNYFSHMIELNKNRSSIIKSKKFVIQKYIEKPLLYRGRKFDMRMWVLIDQEMKVYLFKEGYLRTSVKEYSLESNLLKDKATHLTNNAVQKNMKGYGKYEEGNQVSLKSFQEYLDEIHSNISLRNNLFLQMEKLISMSCKSVKNKINANQREFQFEIFGYDFIIDKNFKVWLIEVNTTPCLEESSNILKMLLPRMLNDAFSLTINKVFKESIYENQKNIYEVEGYDNHENLWDFICDLKLG